MTIRLIDLGDDRHGLIRAVIPAPGVTGQRQVGYAIPLPDEDLYLVRVAGRRAYRVLSYRKAIAALQAIEATP